MYHCSGGEPNTSNNGQEAGTGSVELPDLFCALGCLILEGRLPTGREDSVEEFGKSGGRGYCEGPHVELPGKVSKHKCSSEHNLVILLNN